MLSKFQQAALQEMGIVVWQRQSEHGGTTKTQQATEPDTVEFNSQQPAGRISHAEHLASIKAKLSSSHASPKNHAHNEAEHRPLDEREKSLAIVADISLACQKKRQIVVGTTLSVSDTHIVLPASPSALSPGHKKALWLAISTQP